MKKIDLLSLLSFTSVLIAVFLGVFIIFLIGFLPQRLPLFYSLPWGEAQLSTPWQLLIIPSLIICISLTNLMISWQLHQTQRFFKMTLVFTSIVSALILIVSTFKIFFLFI